MTVVQEGLARHRHADDQLFAAAQSRQQRLECGEQRHEQRAALSGTGLAHRKVQRLVDPEHLACGREGFLARTRAIQRKVKRRYAAGILLDPELFGSGGLGADRGRSLRSTNPRNEAAAGSFAAHAEAIGGIGAGEIAEDHRRGPAVADDVVRGEDQPMHRRRRSRTSARATRAAASSSNGVWVSWSMQALGHRARGSPARHPIRSMNRAATPLDGLDDPLRLAVGDDARAAALRGVRPPFERALHRFAADNGPRSRSTKHWL